MYLKIDFRQGFSSCFGVCVEWSRSLRQSLGERDMLTKFSSADPGLLGSRWRVA